ALGQEGAAGIGDGVDPAAVLLLAADEALVLEQLQDGVDRARAGAVEAAEALLEGADHVVAVAGLLGQQLEDDVLEVAALEEALGAAAAEGVKAAAGIEGARGVAGVGPAPASDVHHRQSLHSDISL